MYHLKSVATNQTKPNWTNAKTVEIYNNHIKKYFFASFHLFLDKMLINWEQHDCYYVSCTFQHSIHSTYNIRTFFLLKCSILFILMCLFICSFPCGVFFLVDVLCGICIIRIHKFSFHLINGRNKRCCAVWNWRSISSKASKRLELRNTRLGKSIAYAG